MTITQPASLISPRGVYAGITATSGNEITINAGDTAHVVLTNLSLNAAGAQFGIRTDTLAALYVEHCSFNGFLDKALEFHPTTSGARLYVIDSTIRRAGVGGIHVIGGR